MTKRGPSEPFTPDMIYDLRGILSTGRKHRDLALLNVHVDTCLRAVDVLSLRVRDISDTMYIKQKKTGRVVKCYLLEEALDAVDAYLASKPLMRDSDLLFPICTTHYGSLIKDWVALLRQSSLKWRSTLNPLRFGTHSLRKANPTKVYAETGDDYACMFMLGQTSIQHTRRYLGLSESVAHTKTLPHRI